MTLTFNDALKDAFIKMLSVPAEKLTRYGRLLFLDNTLLTSRVVAILDLHPASGSSTPDSCFNHLLTSLRCCSSSQWAFGVTLWELMTLGQTPYVDIDPFEMAAYLKDGYRIAQPINCPDEL